jgi:hypothetical protein
VQLSTVDLDEMWFEVLDQYKNVNGMLIVISIIRCAIRIVGPTPLRLLLLFCQQYLLQTSVVNRFFRGGRALKKPALFLLLLIVIVILLIPKPSCSSA